MSNIHRQNRMAPVAKPGHFNDPDMLQVGNVGLTVTEQYSHMSLWCVTSAPLLAGTDVIHASDVTLDILANPEVTAVNQDVGRDGAIQVSCCLVGGKSHSRRAGSTESPVRLIKADSILFLFRPDPATPD